MLDHSRLGSCKKMPVVPLLPFTMLCLPRQATEAINFHSSWLSMETRKCSLRCLSLSFVFLSSTPVYYKSAKSADRIPNALHRAQVLGLRPMQIKITSSAPLIIPIMQLCVSTVILLCRQITPKRRRARPASIVMQCIIITFADFNQLEQELH